MMEAYGRAVVEERVTPRHLRELAAYLRWEYGPGTGPGFILAEMANGAAPPPAKGKWAQGVFHALARAVRAVVPTNRNRRKATVLDR